MLLKAAGRSSKHVRVYADEMFLVEENKAGVRIIGWTVPRGRVLLQWKRVCHNYGTFIEHEDRLPSEDAHMEKLVVLYALAAEAL